MIEILASVPWLALIGLIAGSIMLAQLVRYHRRDDNRYDLWDVLMSKGKADLNKHVIVAFAALTIWVVVWMVQKDKDVETLLLGALGIFVANRAVTAVTDTIKGVPPDAPMQDEIKVVEEEKDGSSR